MNFYNEWARSIRNKLFTSGLYGHQIKYAKFLAEEATNDVTDQNVTDPVVSQSDSGTVVSQNSTDAGDKGQAAAGKSVPYDRFKEVNDAKKLSDERIAELEAENQGLAAQMTIATANRPPVQKNLFEQTAESLGLGDREWLNAKETGEVQARVLQIVTTHAQNQAFMEAHPDYATVVGSYVGRNFVPAVSLQRVLKKLPKTAQIVLSNPNAGQAVYELVKNDPDYIKSQGGGDLTPAQKAAADAAATLEAANRQASISSVQGGGNLDKQSQIEQMSDEDFDKHWNKITGGAI